MEVADRVAVELAGDYDAFLRSLEDRLDLSIDLRGNRVTLSGDEGRVEAAAAVIDELAELVGSGTRLGPGEIEAVASAVEGRERWGACWATSSGATARRSSRPGPPARRSTSRPSASTPSRSASGRPARARRTWPWPWPRRRWPGARWAASS